jgi:large subunit ribosomal protein LP1
MTTAELAPIYAALILNDGGVAISADKVSAILKAAGVNTDAKSVALLAKYFAANDLSAVLASVSLGGGGGGAAASTDSSAPAGAAAAPVKEEKKEEEAVVELAGGFDDLFG